MFVSRWVASLIAQDGQRTPLQSFSAKRQGKKEGKDGGKNRRKKRDGGRSCLPGLF
jgi:hypothetical protein